MAPDSASSLTAAQRARIERQRLRARALQDARLVARPGAVAVVPPKSAPLDSGGGFLLEPSEAAPPPRAAPAPAPLVHASQQPRCSLCDRLFPQSYLFDTFDYSVCDDCRDPDEAHSLMTRTEAKAEFLLQDCDLDSRPPPLRFERRRNPHRGGADMKLYLRPQVADRAIVVWGSEESLAAARTRRTERSEKVRAAGEARRLRALRMDVRSSLFARTKETHKHRWGAEKRVGDEDDDTYERTCLDCGHVETYEKM